MVDLEKKNLNRIWPLVNCICLARHGTLEGILLVEAAN
jgi:hypothetical protein